MNTDSSISNLQADIIREWSPNKRFEMMCAMTEFVTQNALDRIHEIYPDLDEKEVKIAFVELNYGRDLADFYRKALNHESRWYFRCLEVNF